MASLAAERQLDKDVASNAGVIPIFPWIENGQPKDNMVPLVYGDELQRRKGGVLRVCDQDCPYGSVFWRQSNNTSQDRRLIPPGWTNYGGLANFTICSLCKADEIQQEIIEPEERAELEEGREETTIESGGTGGTGSTNKPVQVFPPGNKIVIISATGKSNIGKRKREKTLLERAEGLFKGKLDSEKYNNLIKAIEDEKRKLLREAAEKRRNSKAAEKHRNSSTTGGKKRRKSRRRKRTRKRRKSRRRKRR